MNKVKKYVRLRWMAALLLVVGAVLFWSFKNGDSRSFQVIRLHTAFPGLTLFPVRCKDLRRRPSCSSHFLIYINLYIAVF